MFDNLIIAWIVQATKIAQEVDNSEIENQKVAKIENAAEKGRRNDIIKNDIQHFSDMFLILKDRAVSPLSHVY